MRPSVISGWAASGQARPLGGAAPRADSEPGGWVPPEITDGLMGPQGRVFGVGGSTGAFYVSHDVYRGRSNPELSQN